MTAGRDARNETSEPEQDRALPPDSVGLLEGICSTRAIRRYRSDPVPDHVLRDVLFAASRAPSGSNRQPFRFLVLTDGPKAEAAKALVASGARRAWGTKRSTDRYDEGSGADSTSPKASMARTMDAYVDRPGPRAGADPGLPDPLPGTQSGRGCLDLPGLPEPAVGGTGARATGG